MDHYTVDGILLHLEGAMLIIEFPIDGVMHRFWMNMITASKFAESILKLVLGKTQ